MKKMAMDTSIKENNKGACNGGSPEQVTIKNGNGYKKNGKSHINANGNNYIKKEAAYKTDALECAEENINCGLGPCTPKWLQVRNIHVVTPLSASIMPPLHSRPS